MTGTDDASGSRLRPDAFSRKRDASIATVVYVALTLVLTWPLARGIAHDIPGDFGDPLLNTWILAWDATHLGRGWWNANIFHPHPLSLAYSEHLLPQALQILPIYAVTKNPILCYNLIFLSTFALSGLGMFLFARELTGDRAAAFVAGLAYAFAPYRIGSIPHLQVLSSAWMPFALLGFRRYFATLRLVPLVGGSVAWLLQNLSCGYYLLFFSPIALLYIVWEMTTRRLWTNARVLTAIAASCAAVATTTLPFVVPYAELRRLGFSPRSLAETDRFSADVYGYLTADPNLRLWGSLVRGWSKAEGSLFPGFTTAALALAAVVPGLIGARAFSRVMLPGRERWTQRLAVHRVLVSVFAAYCALLVALLLGWPVRIPGLKVTSVPRTLLLATTSGVALVTVSPRARAKVASGLRSPAGFFAFATLFAVVMSFGPDVHSKGRVVAETNLYALFFNFVPGFDGVRAPARFAMIVALGLATLAAYGFVVVARHVRPRRGASIVATLIVAEAVAVPIPINQTSSDYQQSKLAVLPDHLSRSDASALYGFIAQLPDSAAIVELPLGEPAFDVRYMFYSTGHWKRLVNGYSGGAPVEYGLLDQSLRDAVERPEQAWQSLRDAQATHVIVHEKSYAENRGRAVAAWLQTHGAVEIAAFDADRVFLLPSARALPADGHRF